MNSTKNLLAAIFIVLLAIPPIKAQSTDSTTTNPLLARNLVYGTIAVSVPLAYGFIGLGYERFITNAISLAGGMVIGPGSGITLQIDADYSIWAYNFRLYAGPNCGAFIYDRGIANQEYATELYTGIKLGCQYHPRDSGFSFGMYGLQWMVRYSSVSHALQVAPLSALSKLVAPFLGFNIGYAF